MRVNRFRAFVVVIVTLLASLAVARPAAASSAPESNTAAWTCTRIKSNGTLVYSGRVLYSNTTASRVSIDRVVFDKAMWTPKGSTARRVAFIQAGVLVYDGHNTLIRDNIVADPWSGASAVFFWPQKWLWGTKSSPIIVVVDMDAAIDTAGYCQKPLYFWG
jgi:hypothetical protein